VAVSRSGTRSDSSLPALVTQLWDLVRRYALEQTMDPVKGLGRWVAFGLAGSFALGVGLVLWAVAVLRVLQEETGGTFDDNWSWVPYLIVLVACVVVAVLALSRTRRRKEPFT
jgi:hypothetical protein